ncbi:MAG: GNAT family N-acetyltransferase [Actinomycetota bacterium]|nr:GNAT family N-acetyltransferase [Actinomycetota bacterium]
MADVSVRPARPDDVAEVARVQVDTWRTCYLAILPAPVIESLSVEVADAVWRQAVTTLPSSRHHVLVAQDREPVVGFVAFGPADDLEAQDPDPETTVALGPLLVEPRWGRRGHGSRLLAAAVDLARLDGMTRAVAWIPEGDVVSRSFFESAGWAPDGLARALDTGAGELREIRLHARLAEAAA